MRIYSSLPVIRIILVFSCGWLAFVSPGLADEDKLTIIGRHTCVDWTADRAPTKDTLAIGALSDESWLGGVLTGMNLAYSASQPRGARVKDVIGKVSVQTVYDWTDRYCKQNPRNDLLEAAVTLFGELKRLQEDAAAKSEK